MRIPLIYSFLFFPIVFLYSQNKTLVSGKVVDAKTALPIASVVVGLQNTSMMQLTDASGVFSLEVEAAGNYLLQVHNQGYKDLLLTIEVNKNQNLSLGILTMEEDMATEQQSNTIRLLDEELQDDSGSFISSSILLQSTKDVFQQAAAFNWGAARFRIRGLDTEHAVTLLNGVKMNKMYDGRPQWSNWGGLNDVTRNQELTIGTTASDYSFGGLLGTQQIHTRASVFKAGSRITFSATNTNYSWRTIGTYASGLHSNGWAYVISAGKRWANEAYFEGTTYDANSLFIGIEKKLNDQHALNFSGFYTPNTRGKNSPNTDEVNQLTASTYNSYWGYQNGKKRNARIKTIEEPILMLNHYFTLNDHSSWTTSLVYQFGKTSNSNIDYQNANSPDPTYYRKLPSYYLSLYAPDQGEYAGAFIPDLPNAEKNKEEFFANTQINWNKLYLTNQNPVLDNQGKIIRYTPAQSHYVVYEDCSFDKSIMGNTLFTTTINTNVSLHAGASFSKLKSHNYQQLTDLLGGLYFEDFDPYYTGNASQSDLHHPNRQVVKGDKYGYNYLLWAQTIEAFTQFRFQYQKVDFYLAQSFSKTQYEREGLYKNGLYPSTSFGKSTKLNFENFGFKGGLIYKISGRQSVTFNAAHSTKAPTLKSSFPNARINNSVVQELQSETNSSLDISYYYRVPQWQTRLTTYHISQLNATQNSFFYAEGIFDNGAGYTNTNAFVGQSLTHLNKSNQGLEWSLAYNISTTFKTNLAIAYGQYIYTNNPNLVVTNDTWATEENQNPRFDFGTTLLKNYKQAGMPQQAYSWGLEYRNPKYWWLATNINLLDGRYVDLSPIARTSRFYTNPTSGFPFPEATEERAKILLEQEKLPAITLVNVLGGKSWHIQKNYLGLFISINNVLDTHYKTGGFEQARNANFRQRNQDVSSNNPSFGNKYFQGYGRTFYMNLTLSL
ncbi:carboxypeptidase-like regulatory domain-containing protein [Flavobacterium sp. UMI-01]|uniref:carboxypeptidase-like regulatory domain-containing protein n=1 Tax=Flavobacterium sp. UMI-01 TaxID=1441053 RepID=UPI001C7D78D1|nr:carboxypeptidase-like regulatory domain-containing protein [Flavobacterium sp. UMI-01]